MRNIIFLIITSLAVGGCFASDDMVPIEDVYQDISKKDCDTLGDGYAGCPAFVPTAANCAGPEANKPWNINGDWVNGQPICLGFEDKIGTCEKCNYLKVPDADFNKCLNHRFVACAKAGKLPGQAAAADTCFVTAAQSLTCDKYPTGPDGKIKWPDKGQWTAREMCFMNPPSGQAVKACREKAKCGEKGKKVGCACMPCDPIAVTGGAGSSSGSGETCDTDCEQAVANDPECNPEPVCES